MNPVNRAYGIDFALAQYVGMRRTIPPLWGTVQHAWMEDLPSWTGDRHSRYWPLFVFSERNLRAAREQWPHLTVIAIGDPYWYVLELLTTAESRNLASRPASTIAYPVHADGQDETLPNHASYARFLAEEVDDEITVCLHPLDHWNERIRAVYESQGWRVIHHGDGRNRFFLFCQAAELLRHGRVTSNQLSTAVLHGAALGRHVDVSGPDFKYEAADVLEQQRARWPALHDGGVAGEDAFALAAEELGRPFVRAPEELAELLGWRGWRRARSTAAWPLYMARLHQEGRARPVTQRSLADTPGIHRRD